jgi:hypothetical protein
MMRSLLARRNIFLVLSAVAILTVVLLASGLSNVDFAEPRPFNRAESEDISFSVAALVQDLASISRWKQILFWVGVYLIVLIVTSILSPDLRKKLLSATAKFAVLSILILYLVQNGERFGFADLESSATEGAQGTAPVLDLEPPVFTAPEIPPAFTYLFSVAFVLVGIGFAWYIGRSFSFRRTVPVKDLPLEEIAAAARSSLHDLSAGRDWEDSILRCYMRMTDVVAHKRGFEREVYITPSEFASHLEGAGLPSQAVRRLTNLFESVRYGARDSGTPEVTEAADCLREILHYCGEAG